MVSERRTLWSYRKWILAGLLLRVAAMPIAYHGDLYSVYWRAHLLAYHGRLPEHNQLLSHLVHAAVLTAYRPFWPALQDVWAHPFDYEDSAVPFLRQPAFPWLLVLLKLPYLLFDAGCLAVLYRLVAGRAGEKTAIAFWSLNPVLLFAVYVYGRYETIPLFLVLLSLLLARNRRYVWAALVLSASMATRLYTVLLAPFYVVLLGDSWAERVKIFAALFLPIGVVLGLQAISMSSGQSFLAHAELLSFLSMPHRVFLFAAKIPILKMDNIQLWPLLMTLLILAAHFGRSRGFEPLWRYGLAAHLLLFSLVLFHPQWFAWVVPFLALLVVERRALVWLHVLQVLGLSVYALQFGWAMTTGLFTPVLGWTRAVAYPSPLDLLGRLGLGGVFVGFWRSVFTAVNVWLIGETLIPAWRRPKRHGPDQPRSVGSSS